MRCYVDEDIIRDSLRMSNLFSRQFAIRISICLVKFVQIKIYIGEEISRLYANICSPVYRGRQLEKNLGDLPGISLNRQYVHGRKGTRCRISELEKTGVSLAFLFRGEGDIFAPKHSRSAQTAALVAFGLESRNLSTIGPHNSASPNRKHANIPVESINTDDINTEKRDMSNTTLVESLNKHIVTLESVIEELRKEKAELNKEVVELRKENKRLLTLSPGKDMTQAGSG